MYVKKKQAIKVHCNPKMSIILIFKLFPNIQNYLNWHENFTTISRLQLQQNPTNIIENELWMKEIQAPEVVVIKRQLGELKLTPWTLNGFQKTSASWIDLM